MFCEASLFVLAKTCLAWKMSDYALHFGLFGTATKKLHAAL
jgi:hypothetical protein